MKVDSEVYHALGHALSILLPQFNCALFPLLGSWLIYYSYMALFIPCFLLFFLFKGQL